MKEVITIERERVKTGKIQDNQKRAGGVSNFI
jgi:hypothetical protein